MLRIGVFSPSVPLRVARRAGLLPVEVDEVPVASSPAQFASLLDGSLDAALTSPDNVLAHRYVRAREDVRIVSAVDRGLGLALYGRRDGVLGVDVPDSGFAFASYALLSFLGVRNYEVAALGATPRRLTGLLEGSCDVTMLNAGNDLRAAAAGVPMLARVSDVCGPYLGTVLAVAGPPSAEVQAVADAVRLTTARILADLLEDVVLEVATEIVGPDLALRYLPVLLSPSEGLVPGGVVDPASLATVVALRKRFRPGDDFALDADLVVPA